MDRRQPVLSVETVDEFHKAQRQGLPVLLGEWTHGESLTRIAGALMRRTQI